MKRTLAILLPLFLFLTKPNCQVNLNNGLVAYYPFNGNANDASGNGLNGTLFNGVTFIADKQGNPNSAAHFDGIDDYIQVANNALLNATDAMSIALYFNPEQNGTQTLVGKIDFTQSSGTQFQMGIDYNLYPGVFFGANRASNGCIGLTNNGSYVNSVNSITTNQWYCVVATYNQGEMKMYLNGTLIKTINAGFSSLNQCTNADLQIGMWWSLDPQRFKGTIDDIRIYNRALNQDEVTALNICGIPSNAEYIINDYTEVLGFDPCQNILKVTDATKFNAGDTVLLIQMKGAVIDSTNTSNFGNIKDYKNAGNYEFNIVKQKTGNNLELKNNLTHQYDIPNGIVQLVRIPYFQDYTVPATKNLSCLKWDGSKGGVLAVNIQNNLRLDGNMDVSGKGFSGASGINTKLISTNCNQNEYNYAAGTLLAAMKGESITTIGAQIFAGKGSPANAGGGGLDHNSGGGGGSNGGNGGFGGYQLEACTNSAFDNRGIGGRKIDYPSLPQRAFLGGGGGAGHCNNGYFKADGGNGGGLIIVQCGQLINPAAGEIRANGSNAAECDPATVADCHDGSGGGGGGGSILVSVNSISNPTSFIAKGGKGGNLTVLDIPAGAGRIGPGGGGGGGIIGFSTAVAPANAAIVLTGGVNGTILLDNNNPWGTTPGDDGLQLFNHLPQIDNIPFIPNIDSVRINNTQISCSSFDFKGLEYTNVSPITKWAWQFGDGNNSTLQNSPYTYSTNGLFTIILKGSDVNGCSSTDTIKIAITPLALTKSKDTAICKNSSAQLLVQGGITYSWTPQTTLDNYAVANPVATPTTTTTYHVYVTGVNGCVNSDSIKISIRPDPLFSISPASDLCQNSSVQLTASGGDIYSWAPSNTLSNSSISSPIAKPESSTTYTAQITDTVCGNSSSLTTTITVLPSPVIVAHKSNDIECSIGYSQLSAVGGDQYQWTQGSTLSNSNIANPIATPVSPTQYVVKGTNAAGCSSFDSVLIDVKAINKGLFLMPSAFTPNNDGRNDCFGARYWGFITDFNFSVYNRWGERVFYTKDPSECWDGNYKGHPQKADVYVYIIRARSFCEESVFRKGSVALIR